MSDRFTRVYHFDKPMYAEGSPIIIKAGALLLDNETNLLIAQLKLHSISEKTIKFIKARLECFDSLERPLDAYETAEYLDLKVLRDDEFGSQTPIKINNSSTRAYKARIIEVGFSDNSIWTDNGNEWSDLKFQRSISSVITDKAALLQYKRLYDKFSQKANYAVLQDKDLWFCTCGKINHSNESKCYKCGNALKSLLSVDVNTLKKEAVYDMAIELSNKSDIPHLEEAIAKFTSIKEYKNAEAFIEKCRNKKKEIVEAEAIAEKEKLKRRKKVIIILSVIPIFIALAYFVVYPLISFLGGNYAVYINMYNVKKISIPNNETRIDDREFAFCDSLTEITIPDSVTSIGSGAFRDCTGLTSIVIPDSVTSIGDWAFSDCTGLTSIVIPDSVKAIGSSAFEYCTGLTSVTIGNSVTSIGSSAFAYCTGLTSVTIPDSVTSIGDDAFRGCAGLTSIVIPDSVTSIGKNAFRGCSSLESITLPFVGASKNGTDNTHFGYIFGASSYSYNSDYVPSSLKTVVITGGESIGYSAFSNCTGLTSIVIPDSVTSIGENAFYGCTGLTSIVIPDSVTSIGDWAFEFCYSLTNVYYTGTKEEWNAITIGSYNGPLKNATKHYNYTPDN